MPQVPAGAPGTVFHATSSHATDWRTWRRFYLHAVDDSVQEEQPHLGTVALGTHSASACYQGLSVTRQQAIADNDCAGLAISSQVTTTWLTWRDSSTMNSSTTLVPPLVLSSRRTRGTPAPAATRPWQAPCSPACPL